MAALADDQLIELLELTSHSDSVELKLTVPLEHQRKAVQALGLDPLNGQIYQTKLNALTAEITVTYAPHSEIQGLWLPASMEEHYLGAGSDIRATATYSKYRQFRVMTSEQVTVPKK